MPPIAAALDLLLLGPILGCGQSLAREPPGHASNGVKLLPRDVCGALPAKSETHPAGLEGFMASLHMDMSTEGENCISIRIRSPKAIGERLAEEAPADARGEAKAEKPPRAPLLIKSFDSLSSAVTATS